MAKPTAVWAFMAVSVLPAAACLSPDAFFGAIDFAGATQHKVGLDHHCHKLLVSRWPMRLSVNFGES